MERKLAGFKVEGGAVAIAPGTPLEVDGKAVGKATFGAYSPTLEATIGLGYLPPDCARPGVRLSVRNATGTLPARICETPFFDPGGDRIRR